jgi:FKBP-type peptidyl-prolyl cis-trans isomerase FkpA
MKINFLSLLVLIGLITLSCSEKETPGGVKYTVLKKGDGVAVATGQFLVMDILLRDSKDSVWFNTADSDYPAVLAAPDQSMVKDGGEFGVFKTLTKGDCVTFKVSANTVFTKTRQRPVPDGVDTASLFTYVVNLKDVWNEEQIQKFQAEISRESQRKQMAKDSVLIQNYIKENNLETKRTPSGIHYVVLKEGKGELAAPEKVASIHYAGFSLDGKIFDTSLAAVAKANNFNNGGRNEPYPVTVKRGQVIQGWHDMIQMMNKGMKVRAIIPSHLAYGPQGNGPVIPPNAILIFDMELTDIK